MRNKVANPSYALPPSLAPTTLQFMTPHDSRIDGIIWPSLRDRLITNVDYDLNNVLPDLLEAINVHMGDSKDSVSLVLPPPRPPRPFWLRRGLC